MLNTLHPINEIKVDEESGEVLMLRHNPLLLQPIQIGPQLEALGLAGGSAGFPVNDGEEVIVGPLEDCIHCGIQQPDVRYFH